MHIGDRILYGMALALAAVIFSGLGAAGLVCWAADSALSASVAYRRGRRDRR
jgi:hypothetical protein